MYVAGEGATVIEGGGGEEGVWISSMSELRGKWRRRPSLLVLSHTAMPRRPS